MRSFLFQTKTAKGWKTYSEIRTNTLGRAFTMFEASEVDSKKAYDLRVLEITPRRTGKANGLFEKSPKGHTIRATISFRP